MRTAPVSGAFDDIGSAEAAVRKLLAAGYDRDSVHLMLEEMEVVRTSAPAPPTRAEPFALVTSLASGVIVALLAARFAPATIAVSGFGWHVSSVLLLSLTAGAIGWIMGGILGFGMTGRDTATPVQTSIAPPTATVIVEAANRPGDARAILIAAGGRHIRGGDTIRTTQTRAQHV